MKKMLFWILVLSALTLAGCETDLPQNVPINQVEEKTEQEQVWEMAGTWYPTVDDYTGWYDGCVMKIGDLEDGKFKVEFTINDVEYFNEYVELKSDFPDQYQFSVKKDTSGWNDIHIFFRDGVAYADSVGTRGGCRFEKE